MPVVAECSPLVGYVADCRDAVCNESHLRGVATLAWAVFQEFKHSLLTASARAEAIAVFLELSLQNHVRKETYIKHLIVPDWVQSMLTRSPRD